MKKKLLRGIIVAVMGVMLCACGSNGSNTTTEAEASPVVSGIYEYGASACSSQGNRGDGSL